MGFFIGDCVVKFLLIMEVNGMIDELDSFIGEVKYYVFEEMVEIFERIQVQFYDFMVEFVSKGKYLKVSEEDVKWFEGFIYKYEEEVQFKFFVLFGFIIVSVKFDVCRVIVRRVERRVVKFVFDYGFGQNVFVYFNRFSDFFFIMVRVIEKREGKLKEVK